MEIVSQEGIAYIIKELLFGGSLADCGIISEKLPSFWGLTVS